MCVTLVSHRVSEFGKIWQQFSLQVDRSQTEASEQGLSSQGVLTVLTGTTGRTTMLLSSIDKPYLNVLFSDALNQMQSRTQQLKLTPLRTQQKGETVTL